MANAKEQEAINTLLKVVQDLKSENQKFREDVKLQVESLSKNVEQKQLPLTLEHEVIFSINASLSKSLTEALGGYNSPLIRYANNVVLKYQNDIEGIFDKIVDEGIRTDDFKTSIREVLLHKISKTLIAGIDGSVDKTVQQIKQDPIFRSKMVLMVNSLVDEFLNKKL